MLVKEVKKDKIYLLALILSGLFLPWLLISLKFLNFSFLVEELFKLLVIFFFAYKIPGFKDGFLGVFLFGLFFSLSETILYLNNIYVSEEYIFIWGRILLTLPMHILTVIIIFTFGLKDRRYLFLGFVIAVLIHMFFNFLFIL